MRFGNFRGYGQEQQARREPNWTGWIILAATGWIVLSVFREDVRIKR